MDPPNPRESKLIFTAAISSFVLILLTPIFAFFLYLSRRDPLVLARCIGTYVCTVSGMFITTKVVCLKRENRDATKWACLSALVWSLVFGVFPLIFIQWWKMSIRSAILSCAKMVLIVLVIVFVHVPFMVNIRRWLAFFSNPPPVHPVNPSEDIV